AEQKVVATRYKANVDRFKREMIGAFTQTNAAMTSQARTLDAVNEGFGSQFETAVNLDISMLTSPEALIEGIEPNLEIEDPKFYAVKMKENLDKLRTNIEKQNNEIMNGPDGRGGINGEIA